MKKNELLDCIEYYFASCEKGIGFSLFNSSSEDELRKIMDNFSKLILGDHPDGYIRIDDNTVLLVEHFEYDSTKNSKKGSETRQQEASIDREVLLNAKNNETNLITKQLKVTHSTEYLSNNFTSIFSSHNKEIDRYINDLINKKAISESDSIKILFMMEEKSALGTFYFDGRPPMHALNVFQIKECLETVQNSRVDYFMLFNTYNNDRTVFFATKNDILALIQKSKSKSEYKMIDWDPMVITGSIFIPK